MWTGFVLLKVGFHILYEFFETMHEHWIILPSMVEVKLNAFIEVYFG